MSEMKSLLGSEVGNDAGSCYAELLALRFFRRAVRNYTNKKIDDDIFRPLVRNIFNEKCVYDLRNRLTETKTKKSDEKEEWVNPRHVSTQDILCNLWCDPATRDACKVQVMEWADAIIEEYEKLSAGDPLAARLDEIAKLMKLNADEMSVLKVLWLMSIEKLEEVRTAYTMSAISGCIALYTGLSEQQVRKSLMSSSRLSRFGCIDLDNRSSKVNSKIRYYLDGINEEPLVSSYYRKDDAETLPVEFFGKLAEDHLPLLKQMLSGERGRKVNILLTGAPGSGKTEFVKHLASTLGRPLLMRRASDLKSKWVGETEQNIAAAFREAREKRAILFFDEVDTFLDSREAVQQGHEKSMVNEVLQQMESFGGVFVGTTNFKDMLDPAVARRFTFKVELDYLDVDGRCVFWKRFFGSEPRGKIRSRLNGLDRLTPGDFRTVRQELYYLGDDVSDDDRLDALEAELSAKTGVTRRIGFSE